MPREELLSLLDTLRTAYVQELKSCKVTQTDLEGLTSFATRAAKSIQNLPPDEVASVLQQLEGIQAQVRADALGEMLPALKKQVKGLTAIIAALKSANGILSGESVEVVPLDKAIQAVRKVNMDDDRLQPLLDGMDDELRTAQTALGTQFGEELENALSERGLVLNGRPPTFEIGRFVLEIDFVKRKAQLFYGSKAGKMMVQDGITLGIPSVLKAYDNARNIIMERNEDGAAWIKMLHEAWEITRRKRDTEVLRVNLVECYYELVLLRQDKRFTTRPSKNAFRDYTYAQFVYDLDLFAAQQQLRLKDQRVFTYSSTKAQAEAGRALYVVTGNGPNDGEFKGELKFDLDA